jgi:hypothetical protein
MAPTTPHLDSIRVFVEADAKMTPCLQGVHESEIRWNKTDLPGAGDLNGGLDAIFSPLEELGASEQVTIVRHWYGSFAGRRGSLTWTRVGFDGRNISKFYYMLSLLQNKDGG